MKRILCLALAFAAAFLGFGVFAAVGEGNSCGENLVWEVNDGVLHISGTGEMANFKDKQTPWESEKENINSIVIDEGVTSIGDWAFGRMNGVTSLSLPESVTSIGTQAFFRTLDLDEFVLPSKLKKTGNYAFAYSRIKKLTICDTSSLGALAFNNSSVRELIVPESVQAINDGWFNTCTNLKTITFSEGITTIKSTAFKGCTSLETVYLPNTVTNIGKEAFSGCTKLKNVIVPNENVTYGANVFSGDTALTLFGEPGSTTELYANENGIPFEICNVFDNIRWIYKDGTLLIDGKGEIKDFESGKAPWNDVLNSVNNISIGEGITKIGDNSFESINESAEVSLPSTLEYAGENAFGALKKYEVFKNALTKTNDGGEYSVKIFKTDDKAYLYMMLAAVYEYTEKDGATYTESREIKYVPIEINENQKGVFCYSATVQGDNSDNIKTFLFKYPEMIDFDAEVNDGAKSVEDTKLSFLNDGNITVTGNIGKGNQDTANMMVVSDSENDILNANSIKNIEPVSVLQSEVSKDGDFCFNFHMNTDGKYIAYIGNSRIIKPMRIEFVYINEQSEADALNGLNSAQNAEEIKTVLENKQMSLNLFSELYTEVMADEKSINSACEILLDYIKTKKFSTQSEATDKIYKAFAIAQINSGKIDNICKYIDELYSNSAEEAGFVKLEKGKEITDIINKGTNNSIEDFEKNCRDAVIITLIKYNNGTDEIKKALTFYSDKIGINKSSISDELCISIAGKSFLSIKETADYVNNFKTTDKPSKGGTSGGSSSGGSGGGFNNKTYDTKTTEDTQKPQDTIMPFDDINDFKWAESAIVELYKKGIVNGKEKSKFCPTDNITREEFAKLILLALNVNVKPGNISFEDVKTSDWFYEYIQKLYTAGAITGIDEKTFGTGLNITREDAAVMLFRTMKKCGLAEEKEYEDIKLNFDDGNSVSDYARESVSFLNEKKIINGDENHKFNPTNYITRAEAAVLIYAAYNMAAYVA